MQQTDLITTDDPLGEAKTTPSPASVGAQSTALPKNPGLITHLREFNARIYNNFYNTFRFLGYMATLHYSKVLRFVDNKYGFEGWYEKLNNYGLNFKQDDEFKPALFRPDWQNFPRMVLNVCETVLFLVPAAMAYRRDKREFKQQLGDMLGAEMGKDKHTITMKDIKASENPILQTQMNRFKGLYLLRFGQPFTFLWGLGIGATATVFQVVAERSAYFEKNSYERLQKLTQEISNNEWGGWSKNEFTEQLVQIIQQNRAEHKAPPIAIPDLEHYFPLLHKIAQHATDKKWGFQEMTYVLGQVIKEPALPQKAWQTFNELETLGLAGIAKEKRFGRQQPAPAPIIPATEPMLHARPSLPEPEMPAHRAVKEIVARGPKAISGEAMGADMGAAQIASQR